MAPPGIFLRSTCDELIGEEADLIMVSPTKLVAQWQSLLHLHVAEYRICWAADANRILGGCGEEGHLYK